MNKKGQALVEFVLILPIFLLILFVIFDFGNIFYSKYEFQNQSTDIVRLIQNGHSTDTINTYNQLDIKIEPYQTDYQKITITKKIKLVAPFLDRVLGNPYIVKTERIVPNEAS